MAISELTAQRNTNGGGASTSVTFTFPSAPTAGNLVVLGFSWRGDTTVTAVPHSVALATNGGNGSGIDSAIYYKIASGSEGTTWTFTLGASNKSSGVASEWSGIDATPLDKTNSNTGTGTAGTTGLTGTLAQADELIVALYSNVNTNTWSAYDNSQGQVGQAASTGGATSTRNNTAMASRIVTATTSTNYGATLSGSQIWSTAVATFKAYIPITHSTTGALTGPGSAIAGSAARTREHATTGALPGQTATVAGTAARTHAHPTTGAIVGPGSTIAGTAARFRAHPTTGVITGPGAVIVGDANHIGEAVTHDTTGALAGPGSTIVGTAVHNRPHATTGALVSQGSVVVGAAARTRVHSTTGAVIGPGATVAGTALRFRAHATTGALVGPGTTVAGTAAHLRPHATTGALVGPGSVIIGSAQRSGTGAGSTVNFFNGVTASDGIMQFHGICEPFLTLTDAGGGTYNVDKTYEVRSTQGDSVVDETYLVDGNVP